MTRGHANTLSYDRKTVLVCISLVTATKAKNEAEEVGELGKARAEKSLCLCSEHDGMVLSSRSLEKHLRLA